MTTKVTITMDKPNHQDILVETYNPITGKLWTGSTQRLTEGQTVDLYVHGHMAIRVTEIARVAEVEEVEAPPSP